MVEAAEIISPKEADFSPYKTSKTQVECLYFWKKENKAREIIIHGITQPKVATMAPHIPAICMPTKVEVFTAKGPGVILWEKG